MQLLDDPWPNVVRSSLGSPSNIKREEKCIA
jgi:hypothetical protein